MFVLGDHLQRRYQSMEAAALWYLGFWGAQAGKPHSSIESKDRLGRSTGGPQAQVSACLWVSPPRSKSSTFPLTSSAVMPLRSAPPRAGLHGHFPVSDPAVPWGAGAGAASKASYGDSTLVPAHANHFSRYTEQVTKPGTSASCVQRPVFNPWHHRVPRALRSMTP